MESLKTVCAFYDVDWAGILILDRTANVIYLRCNYTQPGMDNYYYR